MLLHKGGGGYRVNPYKGPVLKHFISFLSSVCPEISATGGSWAPLERTGSSDLSHILESAGRRKVTNLEVARIGSLVSEG